MRRVTDWTIRLLLVLCGGAIVGLLIGTLFAVALRALL